MPVLSSLLLLHAGTSSSNGGGGSPPSPFPTGSPTPTPSFSVTPIPTFTLTPTPSSTLTPIPTFTLSPTPTESPTTTASPTPTLSPTTTASPTPTESPTVTASPTPTPTVMPDGIYVFGSNNQGQAGLDSTGILTAITYFSNLNVYQRKIADGNTTGFIKTDNTLWLSGDNDVGQCAQNNFINYSSPVQEITGGQWQQISSGNKFMVAIKQDGSLWSWGQNTSGQLGDGSVINRTSPVREATSATWDYVSAGYEFVLATRLGRLYAWGSNSSGQLGISSVVNVSVPTQIGAATDWELPAAGYLTGACKKSDGTIWTWGGATSGVLGNNVVVSRSSPVQVGADNTWTTMYASYNNFYAQKADSTVWGWGANTNGQLAQNNVINRSSPVLLGTYNYYYPVRDNIYTIDANKKLWGAGTYLGGKLLNRNGTPGNGNASSLIQLGNVGYEWLNFAVQGAASNNTIRLIGNAVPTPTPSGTGPTPTATLSPTPTPTSTFPPTPAPTNTLTPTVTGSPAPTGTATPTPAPPTPSSTAPTPTPSIAPLSDEFYVWGDNTSGEYSNNTQGGTVQRSTPVFIALSDWATIPSGGDAVSGIKNNGTLYMWGLNSSGELGQNNTINRSTPTQVGVSSDWAWVMNDRFTMGVKTDGTLWGWGNNSNGQLGINNIVNRSSPVQVGASSDWARVYVSRFYTGAAFDCTFAIKTNGSLWAWGNNSAGQLGLNNAINSSSPVQVGADLNWSSVAVSGQRFALAIKTNGTLWSVGLNTNGSLGLNNAVNRSSWTQVGTESTWSQVSADYWPVGAIKSNGSLWTWGQNTNGSLGSNIGSAFNRSSPAQVGSETTWAQIECGYASMLGRKSDGTMWAWGTGSAGQGGYNSNVNMSSPTLVAGGYNWFTCSANNRTSFGIVRINAATATPAASATGTPTPTPSPSESPSPTPSPSASLPFQLFAWGANTDGSIGDNTVIPSSSPVNVGGTSTFQSAISSSVPDGGFLDSGNNVYGWGQNTSGQLGTNNVINTSSPVILPIGNFKSISLGGSIGIKDDNTLWVWGNNSYGGLGLNNTVNVSSPTQVSTGAKTPTFVNSHLRITGYVASDGTAFGCGKNVYGNLGIGTTGNISQFTQVLLSDVKQCYIGADDSYWLTNDNTLWGCGLNNFGQTATNNTIASSSPIQIINNVDKFTVGNYSCLAIKFDGTLWAWGDNLLGELGLNNAIRISSPVQVGVDGTWADVINRQSGTLALKKDSTLWAWGFNNNGQVGNQTTLNVSSPTQIGNEALWIAIAKGFNTSYAWKGQPLPTSTITPSVTASPTPTPTPSESPSPTPSPTPSDSPSPTPSPSAFNAWYLWSSNNQGQLNTNSTQAVEGPYNAFSTADYPNIESGSGTTFRKSDGTLWGVGNNSTGQLSQNDIINRSSMVQIATDVVYNASNQTFINFIKSDGTLWTCGTNSSGQLGINTNTNRSSIVQESLGKTDWVKCAVGSSASLAIDSSGRLYATGNGLTGTLGIGIAANRSQFTQVGTDTNWSDITLGAATAFAIKNDGTLWGWGSNTFAQVGVNTIVNISSPVQIAGTWLKAGSAGPATLALKSDNTIWGWGNAVNGQLGDADPNYGVLSSPVLVLSGTWIDFDINNQAAFAINSNYELWGSGISSASSTNMFYYGTQSSFIMLDNGRQWLSFSQVKAQNNNSMNAKALGPVAGTPTPTPSPTIIPTPTPTIAPTAQILGMSSTENLEIYGQNNGEFFAVLTPIGPISSSAYYDVIFNPLANEWVASSVAGDFYYSADGQNWTLTGSVGNTIGGLTFGYTADGTAMVAFTVQYSPAVSRTGYSLDNRTFTVNPTAISATLQDICYANGYFISSSVDIPSQTWRSIDGINYYRVGDAPVVTNYDIVYAPEINTLVQVQQNGNVATYSTDYGTTWTLVNLPSDRRWRGICWTGTKFLCGATNTTEVAQSSNGITWTTSASLASGNSTRMTASAGAVYSVGAGINFLNRSINDGVSWQLVNLSQASQWYSIAGKNPVVTPNLPTATPAVTSSPTPSPSESPTPTESPSPTPSPSVTESPTPTPSPSPSESPTMTPTASATLTPTPTPTATCTPIPLPVTSGMVGWFDASNTATINGGTPTSGVSVSSWGNSTTNATWTGMQQATAAKQPKWYSDGTVAGSYLLFDDVAGANGDGMTTNGAYSLSGACTIVVMEDCFASVGPSRRTIQSASINGLISLNQYGGATTIGCFWGATIVSGYQSGTGKHNGIVTKSAGNALKYYVDGINRTNGSQNNSSNWGQVCFGAAGANANEPANTKLLEVIVYNRELSAAEVTQVSDYLQCKWTNPGPTPQPSVGP